MVAVMEGAGIEPGAVYCPSDTITFLACQEPTTLIVVLPLLERVNVTPLLGYASMMYNLLKKRGREWNVAFDMCWLAGVMREKLGEILKWPELSFGCVFEDRKFLG